MQGQTLVAKRYARAFARLLAGQGQQEGQKHLMALSSVKSLFAVEQARKVLASPVMPSELKKQLLDYALDQGKADPVVRQFIHTVVEAKRVELIPAIIASYEDLLNELSGRIRAHVTTAVELPSEDLEAIRLNLAEALNKKVDIRTAVDPRILGGLVIRIGHSLIDLSMKTKLNALTTSAAL